MALRRAFFAWQFAAAAVLPLWLLLGYALFGASVGGFLTVVLLAPVVLVVEVALALLFSARAGVRRARALDLPAVGVLAAFQAGVIGVGFFGPATAWFGLLAAAAAIGGFWLGGTLLVRDVRTRVQETMTAFGVPPRSRTARPPIDAGEYVVVKPSAR
ncbi:MFS transporter permease [Amnibacterium sp.]|uniref:MFS transporter permease n=1 Tax=Amnibacterium sp. TaxID=1872496 RepID=UPI003F7B61D0